MMGRVARSYRSPQRAEQARRTRRQVLEAATAQFLRSGYSGATVPAIARAAGVSVPTVELLFGTKARLLKAAVNVAIAGDDESVPVLDRAWTARAVRASTLGRSWTSRPAWSRRPSCGPPGSSWPSSRPRGPMRRSPGWPTR
jgi:AcrR family transcriptional regulator